MFIVYSLRLHYIPLSQSYEEIYNIYAFFSGPTKSMLDIVNATASAERQDDGERRLRRIARAGKQWKKTIGRPVDMEGKRDMFWNTRKVTNRVLSCSVRISNSTGMGSTLV